MTTKLHKRSEIAAIAAQIEIHKNAIAKHRDALRDISTELKSVLESTDEGIEYLQWSLDSLSQYL